MRYKAKNYEQVTRCKNSASDRERQRDVERPAILFLKAAIKQNGIKRHVHMTDDQLCCRLYALRGRVWPK